MWYLLWDKLKRKVWHLLWDIGVVYFPLFVVYLMFDILFVVYFPLFVVYILFIVYFNYNYIYFNYCWRSRKYTTHDDVYVVRFLKPTSTGNYMRIFYSQTQDEEDYDMNYKNGMKNNPHSQCNHKIWSLVFHSSCLSFVFLFLYELITQQNRMSLPFIPTAPVSYN